MAELEDAATAATAGLGAAVAATGAEGDTARSGWVVARWNFVQVDLYF